MTAWIYSQWQINTSLKEWEAQHWYITEYIFINQYILSKHVHIESNNCFVYKTRLINNICPENKYILRNNKICNLGQKAVRMNPTAFWPRLHNFLFLNIYSYFLGKCCWLFLFYIQNSYYFQYGHVYLKYIDLWICILYSINAGLPILSMTSSICHWL